MWSFFQSSFSPSAKWYQSTSSNSTKQATHYNTPKPVTPASQTRSGLGETRSSPCLLSHQLPQRRRLPSWNNSRSPLVLGSVSTSSAACCPATPPARCGAQKRNPVTQGRGSGHTPDPPTRSRGNWQRDLSVSYGNAAPSDLSRARTLPSPQSASAGTR